MTINLSDNSPRISYPVASGVTHTNPFDVPFQFFEEGDLNVYVDGILKTITTDYTVAGGSGSTGSITMTVVGASGGSTVVITRSIALERTTDFPSSGPFDVSSLNEELDRITAINADLNDEVNRSLRLTDADAAANLTLPTVASRAGKVLAFDPTTGDLVNGPSTAGVTTIAAAAADIATLTDIQDGTVATNAITDAAAIKTDITAVSNIAAAVSAVNLNETNINAVNLNSSNIDTCAGKASEITSVAAKASLLTSDFVNDLNTLAVTDVIADINLLAASDIVSDINLLATSDIVSDLNQLATSDIITDINLLADSDVITDLNLLGTSDFVSDLNLLADRSTDIGLLADIEDGTVATNAIQTVAANLSGITSFAEIYRSGSTDPTTGLDEGDLFYNSTSNNLKYFNGSEWVVATTSVNGTANRNTYTATAGQTTFSATYDVGFVDVYLNGVKLIVSTDFTATNGTSIVLASGAALNDTVDIVGYGVFDVANVNFSINDATDVNTAGLTNGQVLAFNSSTSDFEPVDAALLSGATFGGLVTLPYANIMLASEIYKSYTTTSGDITAQAFGNVHYCTADQTGNRTFNNKYLGYMPNSETADTSTTAAVLLTNGTTPYVINDVESNGFGSGSTINLKWEGGAAPTAGNANSVDLYTFTFIRTGDKVYTCFASQPVPFA